jgi:RNA polymerase sigma-70 factor (ECF subfamily)
VVDELAQHNRATLHNGDAQAWQEFLTGQIPRLYSFFMKRWPNPALAEELVQKTVFDAVRGRAGYDPERGSPEEWISGIARNVIRLEIRKRAHRSVDGDLSSYLDKIDSQPLPDEVLERKETAEVVRAALKNLDGKEQAVLRAKYIEGRSAKEIGQEMRMTEKAVHSFLYRARISLREKIMRTLSCERGQEQ